MKALMTAAAIAALAVLLPAAASAEVANTSASFYGTLGYDDSSFSHVNLGSIQGRVGARFGQYFGVEGELSAGVKDDKDSVAGSKVKIKQDGQEAIYGVGFLPLSSNFDLLARVGYGHTSGTGPTPGLPSAVKGDSYWKEREAHNRWVEVINLMRTQNFSSADVGKSYLFEVVGTDEGNIWGTDYYTGDSRVAVAAVHSGTLRVGERGLVRVTIVDGSERVFDGSERHGIRSMDYGNYSVAFQTERV